MTHSDGGREELEALAGERHEIRDAGEIPICVGHLRVADIGRERGHGVADIGAMLMPKLDATADEGVAQIVNTRLGMGARAVQPSSPRSRWNTPWMVRFGDGPPDDDRNSSVSRSVAP